MKRALIFAVALTACGGAEQGSGFREVELPAPSCLVDNGSATVETPALLATLTDQHHEGWVASPAVADLDGDGTKEILLPRTDRLLGWHLNGSAPISLTLPGRAWSSVVVGDFHGTPGLEFAAGVRGNLFAWDAAGNALAGFPVTMPDEVRSVSAGDLDGDGDLELIASTNVPKVVGENRDLIFAVHETGKAVDGFPPNISGASQCNGKCNITGGYDQNLAVGDVDGDAQADVLATHDNAFVSLHHGDGKAFNANSLFTTAKKFAGARFLHNYAEAQQGFPADDTTALQANFMKAASALADVDGDGVRELILLSSSRNAAQTDAERGVSLWVVRADGTRLPEWLEPFHVPTYLAGLNDFVDTNVVGATNQVSVADLDPARPGPEFVFAGFDGRIHAVDSVKKSMWSTAYTNDERVLTAGVVIGDLSRDGVPEIVFTTYSPDTNKSKLFVLNAAGEILHEVKLPTRGSMGVPTLSDVDGDGDLEIVVPLKGGDAGQPHMQVYTVPGSGVACLPWPTGRGNLLRSGAL